MKECQALNRDITPKECSRAQKELPKKFCEGCDWYSQKLVELSKAKKEKTSGKYIVRLSKKLKLILQEVSAKEKMQPGQYIAKILAEKLLPK